MDNANSFGDDYVELSKLEYKLNDQRAILKKRINEISNSIIKEEKSYEKFVSTKNLNKELENINDYRIMGQKVINDEIYGLIKLSASLSENFEFFV